MCIKCHAGSYDATIEQLNHDPRLRRLMTWDPQLLFMLLVITSLISKVLAYGDNN